MVELPELKRESDLGLDLFIRPEYSVIANEGSRGGK
jgi:hypothetical protein